MRNYYTQFPLCLSEVIQGAEGVRQSSDDDRGDREKRRQREEEEMEEDVPDISQQEDDLDVCTWCTYGIGFLAFRIRFFYIIFIVIYLFKVNIFLKYFLSKCQEGDF